MMKSSLQLRVGTQLTMTPQLQQAIQLLQLSTLDLRQEIQTALESNPMLELDEEFFDQESSDEEHRDPEAQDEWATDIPTELVLDNEWSDTFPDAALGAIGPSGGEPVDIERNARGETLFDLLSWQTGLLDLDARQRQIAETLLDGLDDSGYLRDPFDELVEGLRAQGLESVDTGEVEAVLFQLQQLEPTGVFARDLQECLLLQLDALPAGTPHLAQARRLVRQFLDALAGCDMKLLKRRLGLNDAELDAVIATIRTLDPYPGQRFSNSTQEYVIPDLALRHYSHIGWQVELNPEALPRVRIQADYANLIRRADKSDDNTFLKQHLQEARWLMKSLSSRNETLLKVGREIMLRQRDFIERGEEGMRPLILADIAEAVGMHESTISRVTTHKYIHTPRGVFELKYFFSSHVGGEGDTHASTAIRARIKKLISEEPARRPLSDARLVSLLAENGIVVARRTVAKYRESMGIPASSERKRLA